MPATMPVGSPPSEMTAGSTCPKPTPDAPKAPDTPNVGDPFDPFAPPGPDEAVVGVVEAGAAVVEVVLECTADVEVVLVCTADVVAVLPACAVGGDTSLEQADSASPEAPATQPPVTRIPERSDRKDGQDRKGREDRSACSRAKCRPGTTPSPAPRPARPARGGDPSRRGGAPRHFAPARLRRAAECGRSGCAVAMSARCARSPPAASPV